jgi:hypothetical protein
MGATSLNVKYPTFCPHSVFMCCVCIWEQTAIISLYSINWLVFITENVFTARYGLDLCMSGKSHQCREFCSLIIIITVIIIHRQNQVANNVNQELAMKCGLSKQPPMPYYKFDPQSVLQNATYNTYYNRSIITDRTVHNNMPDIIILHTITKAAY